MTHLHIEQQQQQINEIHYNRIPSRNCSSSNTNCSCNDYSNSFTYLPMMSPATSSIIQPIDLSLQKLDASHHYHHHLHQQHPQNGDRSLNTSTPSKPVEWHNVTAASNNNHSIKTFNTEAWDLSCRKRHLTSSPNNEIVDNASLTPPKAVKLFKPYLLDDADDDKDNNKKSTNNNNSSSCTTTTITTTNTITSSSSSLSSIKVNEMQSNNSNSKKDDQLSKNQESIIWRNHGPPSSPVYETYLYPSPDTTYPSNFYTYPISYDVTSYWCASQNAVAAAAASPISGYESSTSTYSDLSDPYHLPPSPISSYHHIPSHHLQQQHHHHHRSIYETTNHHHNNHQNWMDNAAKFHNNMILTN